MEWESREFSYGDSGWKDDEIKENATEQKATPKLRSERDIKASPRAPTRFPNTYKALKCPNEGTCVDSFCEFYHSLGERRRDLTQYEYKPILCEYRLDCRYKELCFKAHTLNEVIYHPKCQKTRCFMKDSKGKCLLDNACPGSHSTRSSEQIQNKEQRIRGLKASIELKTKELSSLKQQNCKSCGHPFRACLQSHCTNS